MKRRAAALLLCFLMAFWLSLPPVRAADRVYFTAVGSYVLPLSDNTMPFWSGGYVYIASSIFTGAARETLGISQVLNNDQGRLVLYSGGRSLTYNLSTARANGVTATEMAELLTHLAFYAGWPNAWAAFRMAKEVYKDDDSDALSKEAL